MKILIRSIATLDEVAKCVSIADKLAENHLIPMSINRCRDALISAAKRKKYLRVGILGKEIRCWIFADKAQYPHVDGTIFQQMYYATNLEGLPAVQAAIEMHEGVSNEAEKLGCKYAMVQSSCYGDDFRLADILENNGWKRRGNVLVRSFQ